MIEWLETRVRGFEYVNVVVGFILFQVLWMGFIYFSYAVLGKPITTDGFTLAVATSPRALVLLLIGATIEETLFRFPITFTRVIKAPVWASFLLAILSSVVYGGLHPGAINNLIQGVSGMILCIQFMKCGGFQGNYWRALASCMFTNMVLKALKAAVLLYLLSL